MSTARNMVKEKGIAFFVGTFQCGSDICDDALKYNAIWADKFYTDQHDERATAWYEFQSYLTLINDYPRIQYVNNYSHSEIARHAKKIKDYFDKESPTEIAIYWKYMN